MTLAIVLPVVWFFILGFSMMMYMVMDGFVLGIGILQPLADDKKQQELMMNTAAPIWDGNETWLVMGGAGLMAAFPRAYATVLSSLYLPILAMLIALIFRGVSFEFRFHAVQSRPLWAWAFHLGSLVAAFTQGVIVGAIVKGLPMATLVTPTREFSWLSPFSILTGVGAVLGYALLGATWLGLKTEGRAQKLAHRLARPLIVAVLLIILLVSVFLLFLSPALRERWLTAPTIFYLSPVPVATLAVAAALWRSVTKGHEASAFVLSIVLLMLGFIGLVVGLWPHIVPPDLDIWSTASAPSSQIFTLVGALVTIPVVLVYTAFSYRVFRGKVRADDKFY